MPSFWCIDPKLAADLDFHGWDYIWRGAKPMPPSVVHRTVWGQIKTGGSLIIPGLIMGRRSFALSADTKFAGYVKQGVTLTFHLV